MAEEPTLAEVFDDLFRERLSELRVALPGEVVSYDASRQEADVRPLTKRRLEDEDGEEVAEDLPVVPHVPIAMPRGGGYHASFPLAAGDHVLLVFADVSVDDVRAGRGAVAPSDRAAHHLANAVAYPGGAHPDSAALSGSSDSEMIVGQDGGPEVAINGSTVRLGSRTASEKLITKSEYDALKNHIDTHTHAYTDSGTATLTTPPSDSTAGTPVDTAPSASGTSKVRAE